MKMHSEEDPNRAMPGQNGETMTVTQETQEPLNMSSRQKYKELKSKLKYLIYEHKCFESELYRAQSKLIELSRDKTVLLDQLLQYEPVSDEEEEMTDYSASEDEASEHMSSMPGSVKQQSVESVTGGRSSMSVKSTSSPSSQNSPAAGGGTQVATTPRTSSSLTKQGIAKATVIINTVSNAISSKVSTKAGTKRHAKQTSKSSSSGGGSAAKITKTASRDNSMVSLANPVLSGAGGVSGAGGAASKQKLVVSYPINSITTETPPTSSSATASLAVSTISPLSSSSSSSNNTHSSSTPNTTASKPMNRAAPVQTKNHPSSSSSTSTSTSSASLHVSSMGSVHVTTISSVPPLLSSHLTKGGTTGGHHRSSSSLSSTSSSSSGSESGDTGSDSSSSSDDETMDTSEVGGPVQMSNIKTSSDLPRPKAILSPVKMTPPMLIRGNISTPPPTSPIISSQAAFTSWTPSSVMNRGEVGNSPSTTVSDQGQVGGFGPIAPPLSSPSASLPFSSLSNPGASTSAFQVFSPKQQHASPPTSALQTLPTPDTGPGGGVQKVLLLSNSNSHSSNHP